MCQFWADRPVFAIAKEEAWGIRVVGSVDRGRCTRLFVRNVKKSAKSRLNQEKIVRYIARTAIQSVKTKDVKRKDFVKNCGGMILNMLF